MKPFFHSFLTFFIHLMLLIFVAQKVNGRRLFRKHTIKLARRFEGPRHDTFAPPLLRTLFLAFLFSFYTIFPSYSRSRIFLLIFLFLFSLFNSLTSISLSIVAGTNCLVNEMQISFNCTNTIHSR